MKRTILLILCCGLLLGAAWAQAPDKYKGCSPVGTWFSAGYVLIVTPIAGDEFSLRYEPVYDVGTLGLKSWTMWNGQLARTGANAYRVQAIQMSTTMDDVIELIGIHGYMNFTDCKNVKITYDFFAGYFDPNKEPFVDQPDVDYMPPEGIIENYHHMATQCPACKLPSGAVSQPRQRH